VTESQQLYGCYIGFMMLSPVVFSSMARTFDMLTLAACDEL